MAALDDTATDLRQRIAALRSELDERTAERDEALAQQAATGEILSVISRSPTNIQPVFEAIVARAATLCEAEFSAVARLEEGLLHLVAVHSLSPEETAAFYGLFPRSPERNFAMGRAFVDAQPVNFEDVMAELGYDARTLETLQSVAKYRSFLGVPIFRDRRPIGVIGCGRREVRPFTATQIALVKTFADQAAIAIENVRLFGELAGREVALRESEERHGLVNQAVAEGIYEWDIERNLLWVSSRLIDIFGFHGRELGAGDWNELVHAEDFPRYRTALRDCFKGTTARLDCEYRVRHSDGQYRWIEDRGVPVRSAAGRAVRLVGAITDISDRKETDQALQRSLGAADRDRRGIAGYQQLARRSRAGVRRDSGQSAHAVRRDAGKPVSVRWRAFPRGCDPRLSGRFG
jgi:PAS domain S-box-containing protein